MIWFVMGDLFECDKYLINCFFIRGVGFCSIRGEDVFVF